MRFRSGRGGVTLEKPLVEQPLLLDLAPCLFCLQRPLPLELELPLHGTVGIDLRPLFLMRWSKDNEQGPAWLDLTIDSLTLSVGAQYVGADGVGTNAYPFVDDAVVFSVTAAF